jgi:hypothetical protein
MDTDRADAIQPVAEEQAEIIFLGDMPNARLSLPEPALWTEVLKERMQALRAFVLSLQNWERTRDLRLPFRSVGKAAPSARGLFEGASGLVFEEDFAFP